MCLFALVVMRIASEKTNPVQNNSSKTIPMVDYSWYDCYMIAIADWELLPVFLMSAMAVICASQI